MDGGTSYFDTNGVTRSPQKKTIIKFEKLGLISLAGQVITGLGLTWLYFPAFKGF